MYERIVVRTLTIKFRGYTSKEWVDHVMRVHVDGDDIRLVPTQNGGEEVKMSVVALKAMLDDILPSKPPSGPVPR